ncbi:shikimate dehydrogenase [Stecheria sp. CLA-KB-P133]|uniref:Shikimate kinase n=1 Tax=Grylomicrobium aquisgranensis TaxID=2926318 RepID=A0AB35TZ29_9FIRM|nr:shikimate dehydrogenase [Stecheria sp. CLA-KB-P133]
MKLGLIGKTLGHSWSWQIHDMLIHEHYQNWELSEDEVIPFLEKKDFTGINVTIPYKEKVMTVLDEISPTAEKIGAVNCIINRDGRLYGYNTDCDGFMELVKTAGMHMEGKHAAVLGSGGAAKAVMAGVSQLGGIPVMVSRHPHDDMISYQQMYAMQNRFSFLVNATPVGMFPHMDETPADLDVFEHLEGVVDVVANPLRTKLCFQASCKGMPSTGGLGMLVYQAAAADALFTGQKVPQERIDACLGTLLKERRNIVLIGMPTSGKSSVAQMLGKQSGQQVYDMDTLLEQQFGTSIRTCFETHGEAYFRAKETRLARELASKEGVIISCGGGIIKNPENMQVLSQHGVVVWLQRNSLFPSSDRPLSADEASLKKLYEQRRGLYEMYSDIQVENNGTLEDTAEQILKKIGERK